MSKELSKFAPVPLQKDMWSAHKGTLRCTAFKLRDGSLCLYSPVSGLGDVGQSSLGAIGNVSFLLAPNHYHNKGLAEYSQAFPDARLICSEQARPRLQKQTGLSFEDVGLLNPLLPEGCNILEPEGLKTGEIWMQQKSSAGTIWIVCDAFTGSAKKGEDISTQIELLGTFPKFGIKDAKTYASWVEGRLAADPPALVVPCHGSIIQSQDLAIDIRLLLNR